MPGEEKTQEGTTEKSEGIPLFLVPNFVADLVRKKGTKVFRILVERKFHHKYAVTVETFAEYEERLQRESPAGTEGDGHG